MWLPIVGSPLQPCATDGATGQSRRIVPNSGVVRCRGEVGRGMMSSCHSGMYGDRLSQQRRASWPTGSSEQR